MKLKTKFVCVIILVFNIHGYAFAQVPTLLLTKIKMEILQNARDFNKIRQANMESGINFVVSSDLGALYSQALAEIETCIVANYLFEVGDKKYQSANKEYLALIKSECLSNMDFAIERSFLIQGNAKNPNTLAFSEKLRDNIRKIKKIIEGFAY